MAAVAWATTTDGIILVTQQWAEVAQVSLEDLEIVIIVRPAQEITVHQVQVGLAQ
jgi:hypothetical protein